MLLWLAEMAGVSKKNVLAARRPALKAPRNLGSQCAALREAIPWAVVESSLLGNFSSLKNIMPELHLNLHREFFAKIVGGKKRIERREQSPHWRARLEGRQYEVIKLRNGYALSAPEMLVEFKGLRRYGKGRAAYYAIRLGRVLSIKRRSNRKNTSVR
jgi:hypothetical protein